MRCVIGVCALFALCEVVRAEDRKIVAEIDVAAPRAYVWKLWTTADGLAKFGPEAADIELRPDGKFEWYFSMKAPEGSRGSEGCTVLSFIPLEMLAFTWNAPPSIAELRSAGAKTQVVLAFDEPSPGRTHVRLVQHGFGEGEAWDKYVQYFERAWPHVLDSLKHHCESPEGTKAATQASAAPAPNAERKSWTDKHVTVTATTGRDKRQDFEMTIPAPISEVWAAIATTEGFRRYTGAPQAEIELKPGGRYAVWPGATNRVLAFAPGKMLSTSGSAPPQFPNVRKGGTWSAYWLQPAGGHGTKLRLSVVGWREGEKEWDDAFDYFLKNNPVFLNDMHEKLAKWAEASGSTAGSSSATTTTAPLRHEAVVDAPIEQVWQAFTTKEGLESWMVAMASIDLRVGGKMLTKYKNEGTLGDEGTIENTILSFEPQRMFSIKATRPPKGFPFPKAIESMWSVVYFDPIEGGKTRVACVGLGFGADEESQKLRAFFDQGNAYTISKLAEHFAKKADAPASAR